MKNMDSLTPTQSNDEIGSTDFSMTVNSSCRFFSQNSLDTNMYLERARLAEARRCGSGFLI